MEASDKKKLDKHLPEFVERVDPQVLLPFLRCLRIYSREDITSSRPRHIAAYKLYEHLIKKPKGFKELVVALRHPTVGLEDLADKLDPPEAAAVSGSSFYNTEACAQTGLIRRSASQANCTLDTPWPQLPLRLRTILKRADIGSQTPEYLAGILAFTNEEFDRVKHDVLPGESLTLAIIERWNQNCQIKLRDIMDKLNELNRIDILRDLEEVTGVKFTIPTDGEGASSGAEIDPAQNVTLGFIHKRDQSRRSQVTVSQEENPTLQLLAEDAMQVNSSNGQPQPKLSSNRSVDLEQTVITTTPNSYENNHLKPCKMEDSGKNLEADCTNFQVYTAQEIVRNEKGDSSSLFKAKPSSPTTFSHSQPVGTAVITEHTRETEFYNLSLVKEHIIAEKEVENKLPDDILAAMNNESVFSKSQSTGLEEAVCAQNVTGGTDKLLQDFKQRDFEKRLVNANTSSILMSTTSSVSDKVSTVGQVSRELCFLDGGENYSLEDAKADEPKVPSMSSEYLSIEQKKNKNLPFLDRNRTKTEELSVGSYLSSFALPPNDSVTVRETSLQQSEMDNAMRQQPELPHGTGGLFHQENEDVVKMNEKEKGDPEQPFSKLTSRGPKGCKSGLVERGQQDSETELSKRGQLGVESNQAHRCLQDSQIKLSSTNQLGELAIRGLQDTETEQTRKKQLGGESNQADSGLQDSQNCPVKASWVVRVNSPVEASWMDRVNSPVEASWTDRVNRPVEASWKDRVNSPVEASWTDRVNSPVEASWTGRVNSPVEASWTDRVNSPVEASWMGRVNSPVEAE